MKRTKRVEDVCVYCGEFVGEILEALKDVRRNLEDIAQIMKLQQRVSEREQNDEQQ